MTNFSRLNSVIVIASLVVLVFIFKDHLLIRSNFEGLAGTPFETVHPEKYPAGDILVGDHKIAISECSEKSGFCSRSYPKGYEYAAVVGYRPTEVDFPPRGLEAVLYSQLSVSQPTFLGALFPSLFGDHQSAQSVVLTLDPELQEASYELFQEQRGAAVILDVKTGAVRAMLSSPSYDANKLVVPRDEIESAVARVEHEAGSPMTNRAIGGSLYPPGSTFKLISSALMLEKELVSPDVEVEAPHEYEIDGYVSRNIDDSSCGDGFPIFREAFARSCNTPFAIAARDVTSEDLQAIAMKFGFDQELSIPLRVTPSTVPKTQEDKMRALALVGQGSVRVTPLQMAMVAQTIANGGQQIQPYLVEEFLSADGTSINATEPAALREVIPPAVAEDLKSMMSDVVTAEYGSGYKLLNDGFSVAAKTGTAELEDASGTIYGAVAWTVGFAPVDDPQVAFAVAIEGDKENPLPRGGEVAAPLALEMLKIALEN